MRRIIISFACVSLLLWTAGLCAEPIQVQAIAVVDGDTIGVGPNRYRLVGYDTPEIKTPRRKVFADEKALATIAKERFIELLHIGLLDQTEVPCSWPADTVGTDDCNGGRKCGLLKLNGKNIGDTFIAEELAMPYVCGESRCPRMPKWSKIIKSQFPARRPE
ncbi:thermonuclease family protein [Bradyrhizobium septentrionale]|uniref:Thermonuclease family protein n=1 Tax=Bradyrhizobium septentrionale TaxID=1404411 RepID=A0A973W5R7_9BRAD|nr:thermonuclease family protein [Bradyrhizobium septentrionale]UGY16771.1 thermonuclease family protein [Bradyrhizobium septentrionale]